MNDKVCEILVKIGICVMLISCICCAWRIETDIMFVIFPMSFVFCLMVALIDKLWFTK
jgi:hypothetical protein